jgi:hypothetical protein
VNLFKILSSGDGRINEPNISAFLGYLLDATESHGLESRLIEKILEKIIDKNCSDIRTKWQKLFLNNNQTIKNFSKQSGYAITVELEKVVTLSNDKRRDIDIIVKIFSSNNEKKPLCIVCIENKIDTNSISKGQLDEEFEGIRKEHKTDPIIFIYLTPDSTKAKDEFEVFRNNSTEKDNMLLAHITWNDIAEILRTILAEESQGLIESIHEYSRYTLKAFLNFISSNFKSYIAETEATRGRKNYGKPIREYFLDVWKDSNITYPITVDELKNRIRKDIKEYSGTDIHEGTLQAQVYMYTVNEKNRGHYGVNSPYSDEKNLFYYCDRKLCKYDAENLSQEVNIFYKNIATGEIVFISTKNKNNE